MITEEQFKQFLEDYTKNEPLPDATAWNETSERTAQSFLLQADSVIVQR